jgi:hypothetical protein
MTLLFRFQALCHTAPSLRLFVPNNLTVYHGSLSSEGCACNVFFFFLFLGLVFPLVVYFSPRVALSLSNHCHRSLLTCTRPKWHPIKSCLLLLSVAVGSVLLHSRFVLSVQLFFFFRFGGGRPLHKVQSLILCIPTVHLAIRFTISSPVDFLSSSSDALSILRYRSHLIPELFICPLSCSCCLRPHFLMPLLHSEPFQMSHPGRPSFRSSRCYIVLVVSLVIVFPVPCHICTVHHLSVCDG